MPDDVTAAPAAPVAALAPLSVRAILVVAALAAVGIVHLRLTRVFTIADVFLLQDAPALVLICAVLFVLPWLPAGAEARLAAWMDRPALGRTVLWSCVGLALIAGTAGWTLVFARHPLSQDEFWAQFDARIFSRGVLLAPIPQAWRSLVPALQPMWRLEIAGDTHWSSLYLPVNAAFRAAFGLVHAQALASAAWTALACALTWRLARRFWPGRRDAAVVATLLLGASSQVLVTGMTPYAMSAHLALNLAWLTLFLDDRPWSRVGAAAVGFLACGLHQLIFHPLFVAPFILELWLTRRWRAAAFYTGAYALICGFWTLYWSVSLGLAHVHAASAGGAGAAFLLARLAQMLRDFDPYGLGLMAKNLLRFVAWQHPLALPLLLAALPGAALAKGPLRPLAWGMVLTLATMLILLPAQGLGWGYRYVHGLLGGLTLIGAQGWIRLTDAAGAERAPMIRTAFAAATVIAILVLLPLHLWQAHAYVRPYALADAAIHKTDADVVVVAPAGLRYGLDLVRNDPFLEARPKVLDISSLAPATLARLCGAGSVALFERRDGERLGMPLLKEEPGAQTTRLLAMLADPRLCRVRPLGG